MKKLLLAFSLIIAGVSIAKADVVAGYNGWNYTHLADSGSVFTGAGELGAIYLATGTTGGQWGIAFDSNAVNLVSGFAAFADSDRVTPALPFISTTTVVNAGGEDSNLAATPYKWDMVDNNGDGIQVRDGLYWLPSAGASGEALRTIVKWRRSRR